MQIEQATILLHFRLAHAEKRKNIGGPKLFFETKYEFGLRIFLLKE